MNKTSPVPLQSSDSPASVNNETPENNIQLQVNSHSIQNKTQVFIQVVPITFIGNSRCLDINALLDSGSDTTLIHEDIVKGEKRENSISGAISQTDKIKSELINGNITSENTSNQIQLNKMEVPSFTRYRIYQSEVGQSKV